MTSSEEYLESLLSITKDSIEKALEGQVNDYREALIEYYVQDFAKKMRAHIDGECKKLEINIGEIVRIENGLDVIIRVKANEI